MKSGWRLLERGTERIVVEQLEVADGYWSRLVGLQFRAAPPGGFGLILAPCSSIHTFFVRFPLDLAMLDRDGRVLQVRRGVRPWRVVRPAHGTYAILEVPSGGALGVEVGQSVGLERSAGELRKLSKVLAAWIVEPLRQETSLKRPSER